MIYIDKKKTRITSFTISKTLQQMHLDHIIENLERLSKENFNRVSIPDFDYRTDGSEITIESEYIKGNHIDLSHMNILYEDLVLRPSEYSFHDYQFCNYMTRDGKIYVIDLDDYRVISLEDRKKDWLKIQREEILKLKRLHKLL